MLAIFKNTPLYYSSSGTGNPLLLLHGFLESSKIWHPFIPDLSKTRQVICIDLPGHGKSGVVEEVHTMEMMAYGVAEILKQLEVEKISLVGHSMGGYVCLEFLKKFPHMVNKLVLMNSTPEEDSEERKLQRDRAVALITKNKKAYINMAISNLLPTDSRPGLNHSLEDLKREAHNISDQGIIAALKGMKIRTNHISTLTNFNNDKYMIIGERDPVLNFHQTVNVGIQCGCQLILTKTGHLSYIEDCESIKKILEDVE